jgi:hypothetical protein
MAGKEIAVKKYVVRLSSEERQQLETLIRKGKGRLRGGLEPQAAQDASRVVHFRRRKGSQAESVCFSMDRMRPRAGVTTT